MPWLSWCMKWWGWGGGVCVSSIELTSLPFSLLLCSFRVVASFEVLLWGSVVTVLPSPSFPTSPVLVS